MKSISLLFLPIALVLFSGQYKIGPIDHPPFKIGSGQVPALTKDIKGNLHVVYGSGDSILYTYSTNHGISFAPVELVSTIPGMVAFAMRGPQITATNKGLTIVFCTDAGNIYSYLKHGNGKWMRGGRVTDKDSVAPESFVSLAGDGKSTLFATWLDTRNNKHNKIYGARSEDGGKTWSPNIMIYTSPDTTVCECCKPSVVMNGKNVYVMFRNWLKGNRDMYLIQSSDGGRTFGKALKLGEGTWPLKGCPMDGGGLTVDDKNKVHAVWRRESKIYSGTPGEQEKEIGEGRGCTTENINGENAYAWMENGDVVCILPGRTKKNMGKGMLPVLKAIDEKSILCVWQNENNIYSSVVY